MTAPEPTPTAEHIDAVAVEFEHVVVGSGYYAMNIGTSAANESARAILTSSNPETHEALAANLPADVMLAALVRAGVLIEELGVLALRPDGERWLAARFRTRGAAEAYCHLGAGLAVAHRHVTPWEVAPAHRQMPNSLAPTECPCASCLTEAGVSAWWMIVCDECGNKRCPHGTDHRHECSGSNEPGQAGSRYAAPPEVAP